MSTDNKEHITVVSEAETEKRDGLVTVQRRRKEK